MYRLGGANNYFIRLLKLVCLGIRWNSAWVDCVVAGYAIDF